MGLKIVPGTGRLAPDPRSILAGPSLGDERATRRNRSRLHQFGALEAGIEVRPFDPYDFTQTVLEFIAAPVTELHDARAIVLYARPPFQGRFSVQMAIFGCGIGVRDQPSVQEREGGSTGRRIEARIDRAFPGFGSRFENADQETSVDRGVEIRSRVYFVDRRSRYLEIPAPHMPEHLPGDHGLAQHRKHGSPPREAFQQMYHHPFGNVEIALAGNRIQPIEVLEVGLPRQIRAAQRTHGRVGHPRRISNDQHLFFKAVQRGQPVLREEILAVNLRPLQRSRRVHVVRIDIEAKERLAPGKYFFGGAQKRTLSTGRFDHRSGNNSQTVKQLARPPGKLRGSLEITELHLSYRLRFHPRVTRRIPSTVPAFSMIRLY